jgi:Hemolysin coregulated protein Hcp (TssD)
MPSFKATFKLDGNEFDVISCVYSFGQATDEKGRPASDVQGGNISLQISVDDDSSIMGWMIDPYSKKSGSIVFNKTDQDSTLKEVKFEDGYCVGYSESFNANSASAMTVTLNISARKISVGDATHEKKW